MAEDNVTLPVTPRSTMAEGGNSRRNSLGKVTPSNSGEKIPPTYLRASTGSCHDFCKYGKQHAFEEKARRPFTRRAMKNPHDDQSLVELQTEKTIYSIKHKPSPNSEARAPNTPEIIKQEVSTKSVDRQSPLLSKVLAKKNTSTELLLTKSYDSQTPLFTKLLAKKKMSPEVLLTKSADSQSPILRKTMAKKKMPVQEALTRSVDSQSSIANEIWSEKKISGQGRKKTRMVNRTSPGSRTPLSSKGLKQDMSSSSEKLKVPLKQNSSKPKESNVSTKHASYLKPKLSSPDASKLTGGRRNSDIKKIQRTESPKIIKKLQASPRASLSLKTSRNVVGRGLATPRASMSPRPSLIRVPSLDAKKHKSLKVASSLKNRNKVKNAETEQPKTKNVYPDQSTSEIKEPNGDMVQEKTLYVIKMETENKILESDCNENLSTESSPPPLSSPNSTALPKSPLQSRDEEDEEGSEYTITEAEDDFSSEYDETEYVEDDETLEGEHNGRYRKGGMGLSEDNNGQPVKLLFRRGKVVDIQSENNGPRRLKFRRGSILGEHQNLKANARRSFRKRGDSAITDGKSDSERVVLRHQEVHGKRDARGLFNNVIEETASKLVETRRSKVKALVGAFETVISLQDSKPSANTLS